MTRSLDASTPPVRSSASGANASSSTAWLVSKSSPGAAGRRRFPPQLVVALKALACELPAQSGWPLSRFSVSEIRREVLRRGLVADISGATLWRWLDAAALRPRRHRGWIFPRDSDFAEKAARILDPYEGRWQGSPLGEDEFVLSADEKTSIQARHRRHRGKPPAPGRSAGVENEYKRLGAGACLAAWDVHRAKLFGRRETKNTSAAVDRLVGEVMSQPPYCSARRVFWIRDNCSTHRGDKAAERLPTRWPSAVLVHTPVHASWLHQIEIYFSILQRKALTPNDFSSLDELEARLLGFQQHYEQIATPFRWTFTRHDLKRWLAKLDNSSLTPAA